MKREILGEETREKRSYRETGSETLKGRGEKGG